MSRVLYIKLSLIVIGILIFSGYITYSLIYIPVKTTNSVITPKILHASRGDIYSSNYELMSTSPIMYNIGIDPYFAKQKSKNFNEEIRELAHELSQAGYQSEHDFLKKVYQKIADKNQNLDIKKHASIYEKKELKTFSILKNGKNFGYKEIATKTKRLKPNHPLASKVLGRVDSSEKGDTAYLHFIPRQKAKEGLELTYDFLLRGQDGYCLQKKNKK